MGVFFRLGDVPVPPPGTVSLSIPPLLQGRQGREAFASSSSRRGGGLGQCAPLSSPGGPAGGAGPRSARPKPPASSACRTPVLSSLRRNLLRRSGRPRRGGQALGRKVERRLSGALPEPARRSREREGSLRGIISVVGESSRQGTPSTPPRAGLVWRSRTSLSRLSPCSSRKLAPPLFRPAQGQHCSQGREKSPRRPGSAGCSLALSSFISAGPGFRGPFSSPSPFSSFERACVGCGKPI